MLSRVRAVHFALFLKYISNPVIDVARAATFVTFVFHLLAFGFIYSQQKNNNQNKEVILLIYFV